MSAAKRTPKRPPTVEVSPELCVLRPILCRNVIRNRRFCAAALHSGPFSVDVRLRVVVASICGISAVSGPVCIVRRQNRLRRTQQLCGKNRTGAAAEATEGRN